MSINTSIYTINNNNFNSISSTTTVLSSSNNAVIYNGSYYLVGGNAVVVSPDAVNWSSIPSTISGMTSIKNFAWNTPYLGTPYIKPITIACGEGNHTLAFSDDGIYWKGLGKNVFSTRANKAVWNGIMWVAVGTGSYWVASSYDGIFWLGRDNTLMTEAYDIAWNGTVFVAAGYGATTIAISRDGITWYGTPYAQTFSTQASAVSWTGSIWIALGSGGNTTAYSTSQDAWVWNATTPQNLVITDASSVVLTQSLTTSEISASSLLSGSSAYYAIDNSMNPTSSTDWKSNTATYSASTGINTGSTTATVYNGSLTASGEWIQINAKAQITPVYYHLSWYLDTSSNTYIIPREWYLLGSNDATSWSLVDYFNYGTTTAPTSTASPFLIKLKNIYSNTQSYQYFRVVIPSIFAGGSLTYTRISEFDLFIENLNSRTISPYLKPVITRTHVLYPTTIIPFSANTKKQTVYLMTDLCGNFVSNNTVNNGSITTNIVAGAYNNIITSTAFDGQNLIATTLKGNVCYANNGSLNTNQTFDVSLNGVLINKKITGNVYSSCYNGKYFLLGGNGTNVITYGPSLQNSPDASFNATINANNLFTTVWGLASNSGYGPVYIGNRIYFNPGDKISLVAPKAYNKNLSNNNTFSFNLNNTVIVQNIVLPTTPTILYYFGPTGPIGPRGPTGPQGPAILGATGQMGVRGVLGPQGPTGFMGSAGATSHNGSVGGVGNTGAGGASGATGAIGTRGTIGNTGNTGVKGPTGIVGHMGDLIQGSFGDTGLGGVMGPTGLIGVGYTGEQGPPNYVKGGTGTFGATGCHGDIDTQYWNLNTATNTIYTLSNVGIENPTPNYIIDISGNMGILGNLSVSQNTYITGNTTAHNLVIGKPTGTKTLDISGNMKISQHLLINTRTITPPFILDVSGRVFMKSIHTLGINKNITVPSIIDASYITVNYSLGDCLYVDPGSTISSNFSMFIENLPTIANRDNKITLIINYSNAGINRFYCNRVVLGGTTVYPFFNGGNPSIIYTTVSHVVQEFSIIKVGSSYRIFCLFKDFS
jgi:hypothetical protein